MNSLARNLMAACVAACVLPVLAGTVTVIVVDKEGKPVPDAVVVVTPTGKGTPRQPLASAATINQLKMQFVPAVTLVPVGARLTFVNNDSWEHHVRGSAAGLAQFSAKAGDGFEFRLDGRPEGKPASTAEVVLDKAGAVLLGCHLHGSMRGYVYVADSPWAMKTTAEGQAVLEVPDGAASVRVWHPEQLIDLPAQAVAVSATPARLGMQLQVVPRRRRV